MARGGKREGAGRPEGSQNKVTLEAKEALQECFERIGSVESLAVWAEENRTDFYKIWSKIIPHTVAGDAKNPVELVVTFHADRS